MAAIKSSEQDEDQLQQTPNFSDLDKGWAWVVLLASFGSFLIIGGSVYGVGIIHIALLERYKQDVTTTAWVGALHSALMNLGGRKQIYLPFTYYDKVNTHAFTLDSSLKVVWPFFFFFFLRTLLLKISNCSPCRQMLSF